VPAELDDLTAQHRELAGLLEGLDAAGWAAPSRCDGWTVSDVVLHLAQIDEVALASLEHLVPAELDHVAHAFTGATDVDDGAARLVAAERGGLTAAQVHQRWIDATARLRAALAGHDPSDRVPWVVGTLSARTLATTRLAECWIHTGDVAHGLGVELPATDRLRPIARLAWRTLPYSFARAGREMHGPVALHLTGPGGDVWRIEEDSPAATLVTGPALDLCQVAGQRADAADTALTATGPDAGAVLELIRTFA
jgi:uncharacterized protein (TIGR03084 family)